MLASMEAAVKPSCKDLRRFSLAMSLASYNRKQGIYLESNPKLVILGACLDGH